MTKSNTIRVTTEFLTLAFYVAVVLGVGRASAAPRVELKVVGAGGSAAHEWGRALAKVPFSSVRLVAGEEGSPSMELTGSAQSGTYRVQGVIDSRNQLRLPDATFRVTDRAGITEWIESLSKVRADTGTGGGGRGERMAFDFSAEQLVRVTESLRVSVRETTKGRSARKIVAEINELVSPPIVFSGDAWAAMPAAETVTEELSGLSAGTVLAAVLRPLGLVMLPDAGTSSMRLVVRRVREAEEHWPVGWPAGGTAHEIVPKLHEFLKVEIDETPLREAVAALAGRLELPVLYDQNGMARKRIDPDELLVSFPLKRTFYSRILRNVLAQGKLKFELRLDEADRPFLWVSP